MKRIPKQQPVPTAPEGMAEPSGRSIALDYTLVGVFLLLGLLLRISYLTEIRNQPDFDTPLLDGAYYDYWARGIAFGDWARSPDQLDPEIRTSPFCRPPGYPYFLAGVYWITGGSFLAIRYVQMAIGLASAVLSFFLARRFLGRLAGLVACFLMSTYWVFIYYEGELNTPPVVVFLLLTIMLLACQWLKKGARAYAALVGAFCGLLTVFRPESVLFLPFLAGWWWSVGFRRATVRRLAADIVILAAAWGIVMSPVVVRNYVVSGEIVFCTSGGINLYACNNEYSDGTWPMIDFVNVLGIDASGVDNNAFPLYVRALRHKLNDESVSFSQTSRYFTYLAKDFMLNNPKRTLELLGKRALLFWGPIEVANTKEIHYAKAFSPTLRRLPGFPMVAALFVVGVFCFLRYPMRVKGDSLRPLGWLLLLYVAVSFCTVIWFMAAARFRVPAIPFLLIFGAEGVGAFLENVRVRNRRRAATLAILFASALGAFSVNLAGYSPSFAQWCSQLSLTYESKNDLENAEAALRQAVDTNDPRWPVPQLLGQMLMKRGRPKEALEFFEKAMTGGPAAVARACTGAGYAFERMGKAEEAIEMYKKALAADEKFTLARTNLGNILVEQKRYQEAAAEFERLTTDLRQRKHAMHNLAWIAELQGQRQEAKLKYEQVLAEFPDYAESHNNLGYLLQQEGRFQEAAAHYLAAIKISPDFQLARENLALLLLSKGELGPATDQLREILRIDPQNEFARDSLQRLGAKP